MPPRGTRRQPWQATLLDALAVLLGISLLGVLLVLLLDATQLPWWARLMAAVLTGFAAFRLVDFINERRDHYLKKAGYGTQALRGVIGEADREVNADVIALTDVSVGDQCSTNINVSWTRMQVGHEAKIPCVMELVRPSWHWSINASLGYLRTRIRLFDLLAYEAWKLKLPEEDPRVVPRKAKLPGRTVLGAHPRGMVLDAARRIFGQQEMPRFRGIVRIERGQVVCLQEGGLLEGSHLRMVANWLIRIAERTEAEF